MAMVARKNINWILVKIFSPILIIAILIFIFINQTNSCKNLSESEYLSIAQKALNGKQILRNNLVMGQWNVQRLRLLDNNENLYKTNQMGFIQIPVMYVTSKSIVFYIRIHDDCDIEWINN